MNAYLDYRGKLDAGLRKRRVNALAMYTHDEANTV